MKPPIAFITVAAIGIVIMIALSGATLQSIVFWAIVCPVTVALLVWLFGHMLRMRP